MENDPNLRKSIRIHSYYLCLYLGTHRKHGITRQCVNCDAIEEAFMELLWKVGRVQGTVQ